MNSNQQKGIALQIEDTINTMQLRLQLNQQAINTQLNRSAYVNDGLDFIRAVNHQKHQTKSVIEDCKSSIAKLLLLKDSLSSLSVIKATQLLKNCEKYSLEYFEQQIITQINSRPRKAQ